MNSESQLLSLGDMKICDMCNSQKASHYDVKTDFYLCNNCAPKSATAYPIKKFKTTHIILPKEK
jgi:protein-arginine kinase activator protein McsA